MRVLSLVLCLCLVCQIVGAPVAFAEPVEPDESRISGHDQADSNSVQAAVNACLQGLLAGISSSDALTDAASAASFDDSTGAGDISALELVEGDILDPSDGTGTWIAYDLLRAGMLEQGVATQAYAARLSAYVTESYAGDQQGLDAYSPTTWARIAIVSHAFGEDPQSMGKTPQGSPANLLNDGIYNWSYTSNLGDQGSNAYIYALQTIVACGSEDPTDAHYTQQDILDGLLDCQADDGSFSLSPGSVTGSVDLTGMALAALAPYKDDPSVSLAIDDALEYLSQRQGSDGCFQTEGETSSESCAMVVVGLSALGIDAHADKRFVKKNGTALSGLLSFQKADGSFVHAQDEDVDRFQLLPTEQALRALLSYLEYEQGADGNIYTVDMPLALEGMVPLEADAGDAPVSFEARSVAWGPRLGSLALGAGLGCVVVVIVWGIRRALRKRRLQKG